jgi:hypothetical protein
MDHDEIKPQTLQGARAIKEACKIYKLSDHTDTRHVQRIVGWESCKGMAGQWRGYKDFV